MRIKNNSTAPQGVHHTEHGIVYIKPGEIWQGTLTEAGAVLVARLPFLTVIEPEPVPEPVPDFNPDTQLNPETTDTPAAPKAKAKRKRGRPPKSAGS